MKVTVIYGSDRKGFTYNMVQMVKKALDKKEKIEYVEYTFPRDMNEYCLGCINCVTKGREYCPHREKMDEIMNNIMTSDGLIMSSAVYCFDVTGAMKTFIDHTASYWMSHRPVPELMDTVGLAVVTAAGAGIGHTKKTLVNTMKYLGFKRCLAASVRSGGYYGKDISPLEKEMSKYAEKFYSLMKKKSKLSTPFFTRFFMKLMGKMISGYKDGEMLDLDKKYWIKMGWIK